MVAWTKAEKAISDQEFPHRVTMFARKEVLIRGHFRTYFFGQPKPGDDVGNYNIFKWLVEMGGYPCKPDLSFVRWCLVHKKQPPVFDEFHDYQWMFKSTGRNKFRVYFKTPSLAVAFKLRFSDTGLFQSIKGKPTRWV